LYIHTPSPSQLYTLSLHDALPISNLLLDTLKASAPARIINVSSDAHTGGKINFDDLNAKNGYGMAGMSAYSNSKLENVMFTYELDRKSTRLNSSHVAISYAVFCLK